MAKPGITELTFVALGLTLSAGAVHAQAAVSMNQAPVPTQALSSRLGIPVVESSTPIPAVQMGGAQPIARLREVQSAASAAGMAWEKVYRVSPAGAGEPVTSLAEARRMTDQPGKVTITARDVPAGSAIRTVASADDATAELADTLHMGSVSINMVGMSVPDAIAALAKRTHTHWAAEYVIAPSDGAGARPELSYRARPRMTQQQFEESRLFNGPVTIDVAPAPPVTTAVTVPVEPAGTTKVATVPTPAVGTPATNPYGMYGAPYSPYGAYGMDPYGPGYARPYGFGGSPYAISPGLTVQPGNPWGGGQTLVFGGANP